MASNPSYLWRTNLAPKYPYMQCKCKQIRQNTEEVIKVRKPNEVSSKILAIIFPAYCRRCYVQIGALYGASMWLEMLSCRMHYDCVMCYAVLAAPAARFIKSGERESVWILMIVTISIIWKEWEEKIHSDYLLLFDPQTSRGYLTKWPVSNKHRLFPIYHRAAGHVRDLKGNIILSSLWPSTIIWSGTKMKATFWPTGYYSSAEQAGPVG